MKKFENFSPTAQIAISKFRKDFPSQARKDWHWKFLRGAFVGYLLALGVNEQLAEEASGFAMMNSFWQ